MIKRPELVALKRGATHVTTQSKDKKTMQEFYNSIAHDVLARTLWGEARGEGSQGMHAVANVVMNRVAIAQKRGAFWWGNNVVQVCHKPYQFSCWNRADPNFIKLRNVEGSNLYFATAQRIAARALAGVLEDITGRATHYHAAHIMPYWAKDKTPCCEIGAHWFYKLLS
ncbi:MAG: cell wall hydrolase [Alphaproteobacteria bacterium]